MSFSPQSELHNSFSMPFGSQLIPGGGVLFRLWAPEAKQVDLCLMPDSSARETISMPSLKNGWYVLHHSGAKVGDLYQFRIDGHLLVPDPASRYQTLDIHGPSVVCDPLEFCWHDQDWLGRPWHETLIYELHIGTFSRQGNFQGVIERLDYLVDLGVTAIELMPVAQFPGKCNWGYDGALLFAPCNRYGRPEELKRLVDESHLRGLMVFLDVVYNHFGPEGNYLYVYARESFFTDELHTPWGSAINFSGLQSRTVRDFYISNALYWLEEYHLDGLRFDAVHAIFDRSSPDILEEIAQAVRQGPGHKKHIHLILENDKNQTRYLAEETADCPRLYNAQWNDDIHHACHVLLTGETEGYYVDYADKPIHYLGRCLSEGFAYQGERSLYRVGKIRGEPSSHLSPATFVSFLQNHDQIGNRAFGERINSLCDPWDLKICTALILLAPSPPLLFMGEEFLATTPFFYFCDFEPELAEKVTKGRREEFAKFSQFRSPQIREQIPDPNAEQTFLMSKLDWYNFDDKERQEYFCFYRDLLALRQLEIVPRMQGMMGGQGYFTVLSDRALQVRWQLGEGSLLVMLMNLSEEQIERDLPLPGRLFYQLSADQQPRSWGCFPEKSLCCYFE